jgi:hypothetical protein
MRTLQKTFIVLLLAVAFAVATGFLVANADTMRVRITGDYDHIIELQTDGVDYSLAGTLFTCDGGPFGVEGAALVLSDTVFARLSGRVRVMQTSDSCYIDQFILGVHGGVLRRWVEADGDALLAIKGARYPIRFVVPPSVRAKIAEAFGWGKR